MSELNTDLVNKFVTVNGRRIRYLEAGSGRPIVAVHALALTSSADIWRPHFDDLAKFGHVYAIDLPGWGHSDFPEDGYSFQSWVDVIKGFFDAMNIEVGDLIGTSLGGWFSALFAHQNPTRIRRLALLEPAGVNPAPPAGILNFKLPTREELSTLYPSSAMADLVFEQVSRPGREEAFRQALKVIIDPAIREEFSLRTRLPEMGMPIFIADWDTNKVISPAHMVEMHSLAPNARLAIVYTDRPDITDLVPPALRFLSAEDVSPVGH